MKVQYERCAGLDVHKKEIVACVRIARGRKVSREVRRFDTMTRGLLELAGWLEESEYGGPHRQDKICLGLGCSFHFSRSDSALR